jgi:DNA-binding NtrC family response regulator
MATVLLVDDEPILLEATRRLLARAGHRVRTAKDLAELPGQLADAAVEIVVTDLNLPDADGRAVLQAIRRSSSTVPILVVTGAPTADSAAAALETSAVRYLLKPVDSAKLLAAIDQAITRPGK